MSSASIDLGANTGSGGSSGVSSLNSQTGALTLVAGSNITITPGVGTLTISASGGGTPAGSTQEVQFNDAGAFGADAEFVWDDTNKNLLLGNQVPLTGDIHGKVRALTDHTDPIFAVNAAYVGYARSHFTVDSPDSVIANYTIAKVELDLGVTLSGAVAGSFANVSRAEATDEGTVPFAAGYVAGITQGGSANKLTGDFAAFLTGFSSVDANPNQITNMYDYLALPNTLGAGAIANRYGIYLNPDAGYTKQNWLSGSVVLGGSSYSAPTTILKVNGDAQISKSVTDDVAVAILAEAATHTTVNGSNNTTGLQTTVTALIDSGATNDKAISGTINTVTRGDGTDDGNADLIEGSLSLIFHNSGASGSTDVVVGHDVAIITQQGTITDLYDFRSERIDTGGTVTTHYGVYITEDTVTPVKNYLSGQTQLGGSSVSIPAGVGLEVAAGGHLRSSGTSPTAVVDANAGTGATASVSNASDVAGLLELVTGTTAASGSQVEVQFDVAYSIAPRVQLTPRNSDGAIQGANMYITSTTTGFTVNAVVALADSTTYQWDYFVMEVN